MPAACVLAAAVVAVAVYLNALNNPFVYDDYHTVVENPSIGRLDLRAIVMHDVTRPLVNLSYAIDRRLWGSAPIGYRATNIALHAANVMLLFVVAGLVYRQPAAGAVDSAGSILAGNSETVAGSFGAAALFAVHPMMTEAVGYISGRSELLCALFFLLAMMAGRRWLLGGGARWAAATAVAWVAALASKEIGAMFPFVLAAYDELLLRPSVEERTQRWRRVHGWLIGTAVAAGLVRVAVLAYIESPGRAAVQWEYALVAIDVVRRYIGLLLIPRHQTIFHAIAGVGGVADRRALIAMTALALVIAAAWLFRRRDAAAAFGILWFLLLLLPSAALTILDQGEPMAEHRVYLASCGLFLLAGTGIRRVHAWSARAGIAARASAVVMFALVLAAFALQTMLRNAVWRDPVALWRESVDLAPTHYRPRLLLGEALQEAGRRDAAIAEYQTAIELRPNDSIGHNKLGAIFVASGRIAEARRQFARAIECDPANDTARRALATLDRLEGRDGRDRDRR